MGSPGSVSINMERTSKSFRSCTWSTPTNSQWLFIAHERRVMVRSCSDGMSTCLRNRSGWISLKNTFTGNSFWLIKTTSQNVIPTVDFFRNQRWCWWRKPWRKHNGLRTINSHNLILLNDSVHTRFGTYHQTSSLLDRSLCHPSVYMDVACEVLSDRLGSDHHPIIITANTSDHPVLERVPK